MKMADIRKKAETLGIKPGKMKKSDLIKMIQMREGNPDCFGADPYGCCEFGCCWRDDCLDNFNKK